MVFNLSVEPLLIFFVTVLKILFDLNKLKFSGYSFLMEAVFKIHSKGYKIKQIPIHFLERKYDKSKMSRIELFRALINLFLLFLQKKLKL